MMKVAIGCVFRAIWIIFVSFEVVFSAEIFDSIKVNFHQTMMEQSALNGLDLNKSEDVLTLIIRNMQEHIVVYPSEGYYYFSFMNNGEIIKGNLLFSKEVRDAGEVYFTYYRMHDDTSLFHKKLTQRDGLQLTRLGTFDYRLEYNCMVRHIKIYDAHEELSHKPKLGENEIYVGPIYDDSGVRFHLVFDTKSKVFIYVHNNMLGYSETYKSLDKDDYLRIGVRTQFVYFNDKRYHRMVLIGVEQDEVLSNTHYDGPFDQLPDSFVSADRLKQLIEEHDPDMKGKIEAYGLFKDDPSSRYAILAYRHYENVKELFVVYRCLQYLDRSDLDQCLVNW